MDDPGLAVVAEPTDSSPAELDKLRLEITQLRRTMYIPWVTAAITIVSTLAGVYQFNIGLAADQKKQIADLTTTLRRDVAAREQEFRKAFLDRRTAEYAKAMEKAADLAEEPQQRAERPHPRD